MKITKFGHSCLLIEQGVARILIDPGAFSKGFEGLTKLDAIFITHQHPDHLVPSNIKALLAGSPDAVVYADEGSAKILNDEGVGAQSAADGGKFEVAGISVEVIGKIHAQIHPTIPDIPNVGYVIDSKFFYPGDHFTDPGRHFDVLATPAGAPWLKISEAIDYLLKMKPNVAIPVHDGVLSDAGRKIHFGALESYGKREGIELRVLEGGQSANF